MNIVIGSDHRGFKLKEKIKKNLQKNNISVEDVGAFNEDSTDYPIFAKKVCDKVKSSNNLGIVICGTGIGMSIACNKIKDIRCAKVNNSEEAYLSKSHNDANVIALSSKVKNSNKIINTFINTPFSNDIKHTNRLNLIKRYEDER